jgi:predicted DNA-binding antitoxin AbrB/MazE fold protein
MSDQIEAIYDHGVLRPLLPLALPDMARVKLIVDASSSGDPTKSATGETATGGEGLVADAKSAEFEAELEHLLFDGPSLPADFSRADIYSNHD